MTSDKIIYELENEVAFITINNPAKMNCMGFQMLHELENIISKIQNDNAVRVIVIKGAGDKAFSTGADLKEFQSLPEEKTSEWIEFGNKVLNKIENLPKPTIAYINGYAIGGGLELALTCDFRVGTGSAVLGNPELQHGWLPGWGGMTRLRRLLGEAKSKEIIMLCEKIPADKALIMGLITKIEGIGQNSLSNMIDHLKKINPITFKLAKAALMDEGRSTYGTDVLFDILALQNVK